MHLYWIFAERKYSVEVYFPIFVCSSNTFEFNKIIFAAAKAAEWRYNEETYRNFFACFNVGFGTCILPISTA